MSVSRKNMQESFAFQNGTPNVVVEWLTTPASYLGGYGFKSRPGDRLYLLRVFFGFSVPPDKCLDSTSN
jgi:hypothetical protein